MAKLIVCEACKKEISVKAKECPGCGHPVPKGMGILTKLFLGIFGIGLFASMVTPKNNSTGAAPTELETPAPRPEPPKDPTLVRREKKFGPRPEQSAWDGSYKVVKQYLLDAANDPDSIKIETCTPVSIDEKVGWLVGCDFRGKNKFGGVVRNSNWFVIKHERVFKVLPITAYKP